MASKRSSQDHHNITGPITLVVGQVTHFSVELFWNLESKSRPREPNAETVTFLIEQEDSKTKGYTTVYTGYSKHHVVEGLEPTTLYKFRLKVAFPNGNFEYSPVVSVSTTRETLNANYFHNAVAVNNEDAVMNTLKERNISIDVLDNYGFTALMTASQKGHFNLVTLLVENGADVKKLNGSGKDSLMLACYSGNLEIAQYLKSKGASWKTRDKAGCMALHSAADGGHINVIEWLIKDGCWVDAKDTLLEWTALMRVSAVSGDEEVASYLIDYGADVNFKDTDGQTPLMVATLNNHERLVQLLLEKGANHLVKNEYGRSILEMAKAFQRTKIIALLENTENN
ncbi:fibronectin type 3 and ankyrin repeat domains protein 1 [Lissotriton helveticus]